MKILPIFVSCFLLAGAVNAQDNSAPQAMESAPDDVRGDKGFALGKELHGTEYKNSFGRRLANTVVFLVNYKKLLDNIPLAGYSLREILETGCKEDAIPGQIALVYKEGGSEEDRIRRVKGAKLAPKDSSSPITLHNLCAWIEELKIKDFEDLKDSEFFDIEELKRGRMGKEAPLDKLDKLYILMKDPLRSNIGVSLWVERSAFR